MNFRKSEEGGYNDKILRHEAQQGAEDEHNMSLLQALKTYKRAALWSIRKFRRPRSCWPSSSRHIQNIPPFSDIRSPGLQ
jgi:hypothetical protein